MPDAPLRLAVPAPAAPPPRPPFPLVAALAPLAVSAVVWAVTGSAFALLFAALGPVVAVAGVLDGARQRRRARRREAVRYDAALTALAERVDALLEERRSRLQGLRPDPGDPVAALGIAAAWARSDPPRVVVGLADQPTAIELAEEPEGIDAAARARLRALRERAAVLPAAPLAVDPRGGIGIVGAAVPARALARELLLQLVAQFGPASGAVQAPDDEQWAAELPHERLPPPADGEGGRMALVVAAAAPGSAPLRLAVCWAPSPELVPEPVATLLLLPGERPAGLRPAAGSRWQPAALARGEAVAQARALGRLAAQHGTPPRHAALPERLQLAELLRDAGQRPADGPAGLAAPLGAGAEGPVWIDLVRDGPHALVAGTTGSGKSELLVSWVLALALHYPPSMLAFLLVDFKGGASFAPLAGLPHVAGVLSDLDARRARRAMTGLRAELLRRERLLAEAGARSIEGLAAGVLPRLVVVVDEYAAVVSEHPELHELFTDLAARGRSLGVQLVLCTQRPSGVVRDAVLANVTLRIALRLADRADSQAMLGSEAALRLPAASKGRGIVAADGGERIVQFALAGAADVERARSAHPGSGPALQPWSDALPARIRRAGLPRPAGEAEALVFGLVDLPEEQRHAPAAYLPRRHGALLVLGAALSGRSTALAALAEAAGPGAAALPAGPAEAWGALDGLLPALAAGAGPPLVVLDDLDELILRCDPAALPGLLERLERLLRAAPSAGTGVALSARGASTVPGGLLRLVESRLVLRPASRDELLLAGLDARDYDPELPPGSGWWRGRSVQVALPEGEPAAVLAAAARRSAPIAVRLDRPLAVVSARPAADAAAWRAAGLPVLELGGGAEPGPAEQGGGAAGLLVGDPDAWQAAWALLASARRELPFLVDRRVAPGELRALTRVRDDPPPLDAEHDEWWLVADGRVQRARIELPAPGG